MDEESTLWTNHVYPKLISKETDLPWIEAGSVLETYIASEMPPIELCSSAYAFVFKNGAFLQTELREGERPVRQLDIPGGHVDEGETPEEAVIRETFEETGVRIKVRDLVAYSRVTITSDCPANYRYPYPISYILFYEGVVKEETDFKGNEEVHGRVWLLPEEFHRSEFCIKNKALLTKVMESLQASGKSQSP